MSVDVSDRGFVGSGATQIPLNDIVTTSAGAGDPPALVLTALDRNEYPNPVSPGYFAGQGNSAGFSAPVPGTDMWVDSVVFTYQAQTGRYYNSTVGYLDQASFVASSSTNDLANISVFGWNNTNQLNEVASGSGLNYWTSFYYDPAGYLGGVSVTTQPGFSGSTPADPTPADIANIALSFVGQTWNVDGCWTLASIIAAEAGTSLPALSATTSGPGGSNGGWTDIFDARAGQAGDWQSMVQAGDMVAFETTEGTGHITTCVAGAGSTAELVDNEQMAASAGSTVQIAPPHLASQEWALAIPSSVVIYRLNPGVQASGEAAFDSASAAAGQAVAVAQSSAFSTQSQTEIQSLYQNILGRQPSAGEIAGWQNVLAGGASLAAVTMDFAQSPEAQGDIQNLYQQMLNRSAGASEVAAWQNVLGNGASLATLRLDFAQSPEAQNDVQNLYQQVLGRSGGASEVAAWQNVLANGDSLAAVRVAFADSPEASGDLSAVYQAVAGSAPGQSVLATLEARLAGGSTLAGIETSLVSSGAVIGRDITSGISATVGGGTPATMTFIYGSAASDTFDVTASPTEIAENLNPLGSDVATHFNAAQDLVQLSAAMFGNYAAVQAAMTNANGSAVIALGDAGSLTLQGVAPSALHASNFQFV